MVLSVGTEKITSDTPGIDPEAVQLVAQCLNHYATPDPHIYNKIQFYQLTYFINASHANNYNIFTFLYNFVFSLPPFFSILTFVIILLLLNDILAGGWACEGRNVQQEYQRITNDCVWLHVQFVGLNNS